MEDKPKKPTSSEVLSQAPRRENNPDKYGDPHTNWDEKPLSESEVWKSHKSPSTTKDQKLGGAVKPPNKSA